MIVVVRGAGRNQHWTLPGAQRDMIKSKYLKRNGVREECADGGRDNWTGIKPEWRSE